MAKINLKQRDTAAQPNPTIPFDEPSIREHVSILHGLAAGIEGVLVVSAFHANPHGDIDAPGTVTHCRIGDIEGTVDAVMAHSQTPHLNVFIGTQVMRSTLGRGQRGKESDIVAVLALVVDLDADTGLAGHMPVQPSYVLETSPGNYQPFLLLDRPLAPAEAKPLAAALKRASESDHGTADIAHVWRIPGTANWPNKKKLERGRLAYPVAVTIAESWDGALTEVDDLRVTLEPWNKPSPSATGFALGDLPEIGDIAVSAGAAALLGANDVGDRSAHASKVVEKLAFDGISVEQACALFLSPSGDWFSRYENKDPVKDFERLWSKFGAQHAEQREVGAHAADRLRSGRKSLPIAANDNFADDDEEDVATLATNTGLPEALCYPPGAVGDFARFIVSCARFPSPHLALVASLAFTAGMVGRRYKGPTGLRSNLYIIGLAESGFGKDVTIRASAALADSTSFGDKVSEWLFMDQIRSLPGLTNKLRKSPTAVIIQDEFGRFLADHTGRNVATHRAEITTALMELTGAPAGFWGGQEKAAGNIARIIQPCFTIHGVSTPSTFWAALSSGNISEGLLGRLVVIDVGNAEPVKVRRPIGSIEDIPAQLSEQVAGLLGLSAGKYTGPFFALNAKSDEKPHPIMTAEWGEGVDDLFEEFDDRIRAMKKAVDPQYRPILNRVGENAARLALIVAVGCDPKDPVITTEIQEWANAVAEHSLGVILRGANDHISDNEKSAEYLRVRTSITRKGAAGMTQRDVLKSLRGALDKRRLEDILTMLRQAKDIHLAKVVSDSGQTKLRFWGGEFLPEGAEIVPA
ncbi:DNA-primase RepB domain-containing protein [Rhizobium sp. HT1-10]|uniref:DNA-primase RepB domain-containing protein n=1 Tax=Rhizobium sp. HT1-10 TaxID=3111638 RepID=UPI003C19E33C